MTSTKYSISAASRIIGKSRATVSRHMKAGKLSYEIDREGNKLIEASELVRVYNDGCNFDREEKRGQTSETKRSESKSDDGAAAIKQMQDQLLGQYVAQIDHLQQALEKAQDGQNRVTLLLEQRSSTSREWQISLDAMTEKIANQTQTQLQIIQDRHNKEINQLKRILHSERKKSFWQKLLG